MRDIERLWRVVAAADVFATVAYLCLLVKYGSLFLFRFLCENILLTTRTANVWAIRLRCDALYLWKAI